MRTPVIVTFAVVATAVVAGVVAFLLWPTAGAAEGGSDTGRTVTLMGNVTLRSTSVEHWDGTPGEECHGTGGFQDMTTNTPVTVYDSEGDLVAKGALQAGKWYDGCVFSFTIPNVPAGMVQVQVSQRGMVAFSEQDVHDNKVMLQVGP